MKKTGIVFSFALYIHENVFEMLIINAKCICICNTWFHETVLDVWIFSSTIFWFPFVTARDAKRVPVMPLLVIKYWRSKSCKSRAA